MGRRKRYSFYAVRCGLQTGIFNTWEECQAVTHRVSGAKHKGFDYRSDAEAYLAEAPNVALAPKPPIEPGAGTNMTSGRHAVTAPAPSAACPPAPEPPSSPSSDAVFDDGLDDLLSGEFSDDPEMAFYVAIGQQSLTGAVPDEAPPPYSELPPLHPTTRQTTFNSVASSSFLVNPLRTTPTSTMDLLNARQASVPPSPSRSSNPNPPPAAPAAGPAAAPPAQLSPEQQNALSLAISGENLFLTGPGGAGKSFLIDRICAELSAPRPSPSGKPMPGKSVHRTATTGIAALNINGLTIHSWAGIDRGLEKPALIAGTLCATAKRRGAFRRWLEADVLIIDEISMFSDQMLRVVDEVGRHVRKRIWADAVDWPRVGLDPRFGKDFRDRVSEHDIEKPFGGLQVILSGDFYQLPPVDMSKWRPEQVAEDSQTDSQTRDTTMREDLAERPQYAFDGTSWKSLRLRIVELTKVFRQADAAFVGMLNQLRLGHCPEPTERVLRARCRLPSQEEAQKAAKLYGRNIDADTENQRQFGGLQGPEWRYKAWDGYEPDTPQEFRDMLKELTCSFDFRLKLHTRVMLLHNVDTNRGLVNGQTGLVVGFQAPAGKVHRTRLGQMKLGNDEAADSKLRGAYDSWYRENGIDQAEPSGKGKEKAKEEPVRQNFLPVVKWDNGDTSLVEPHYWRIEDHRGRLRAWRIQLPLRHAWAFSIHKSQGLSLDSVVVDLGNCFTDGMAYVALSRCRFLETLFIRGQFRKDAIRASENVSRFYGHESQLARYRRGTGGMASAGPALPPRRAAELSSSPVKLGYSRPQLRTTSAPAVSVAPERAREEPATASAILLCESSDHEDDDRGATAQTNRMQTVHELSSEDGVICIEDSESDSDADSDVLEEGSPVRRPAQAGTSSSPYDPDAAAAAYTVTLSQLRTSFSKPPSASPPNTNPPLKKRRY